MMKNTISSNNILEKSLLAVVVGAGITFSAASAATIVFDAVNTTEVNPFVSTNIDSLVDVTGTNVRIANAASGNVDPTLSPWNGNGYSYVPTTSPGSITYAATTGNFFTDFAAQIIVHEGNVGSTATAALSRFTFESSTDGSAWSTFSVTGVAVALGGAGIADWNHVEVSTTALSGLTDITHLRVTMTMRSGGAVWEQHLGSATMEVVPEPSTALLGGLGMLLLLRRRRK